MPSPHLPAIVAALTRLNAARATFLSRNALAAHIAAELDVTPKTVVRNLPAGEWESLVSNEVSNGDRPDGHDGHQPDETPGQGTCPSCPTCGAPWTPGHVPKRAHDAPAFPSAPGAPPPGPGRTPSGRPPEPVDATGLRGKMRPARRIANELDGWCIDCEEWVDIGAGYISIPYHGPGRAPLRCGVCWASFAWLDRQMSVPAGKRRT